MATSYGSITIVDVTDIGELSVYPVSNMPLSVIYSPDDTTYNPNWGSTNLTLTPKIYYAGEQLIPSANNANILDVTWTKRIGSGQESAISQQAGESVGSDGVLTVSQNQFNNSVGLLTYICTVTYEEPNTSIELTAVGQITFTLVKNAATVKTCTITGENVFKYAADRATVTPTTITLTSQISSTVTNGNWKYYNPNSENADENGYVNFPNTYNPTGINGNSIIVNPNDVIFINNVATIKKTTSDPDTYDIATVVKLYDGAPGDKNIAFVLSNEDEMIPCDSDGTPTAHAFDTAYTDLVVYDGSSVSTGWAFSANPQGVTGSFSGNRYTVSTWTGSSDTATVEFTASKGGTTLNKTMTLIKIKTGQDGTSPIIYRLNCSAIAVNKSIADVYSPAVVTLTADKYDGNTRSNYRGYVIITPYSGGTAGTATVGNMSNTTTPPSFEYTIASPQSGTLDYITVQLKQLDGGGNDLDKQTITITDDGQTGPQGEGAYTVVLGNSHEGIACTSEGITKAQTTINIPFLGYKGTSRAAVTYVSASGVPTGMSISGNTASDTTTTGNVAITVANESNLGGVSSGEITLTFRIDNAQNVPMKFSWAKTLAGSAGTSAILLQCFAPGGDIIENASNNVTLTTKLTEGSEDKTATSYQWYQYSPSSSATDKYDILTGETSSSLTVTPAMVHGFASFKCIAVYKSKSYTTYGAVRDKTDPLQVEVFSSVGTQLLNNIGTGAVYARVYRNGEEIDQIKTVEFVTSTNEAQGSFCYLLNTTAKTCTLMKKNNGTWEQASGSDLPSYYYNWTFRDQNGEITTYNGSANYQGKALYVDGSLIDKRVIFDIEVRDVAPGE